MTRSPSTRRSVRRPYGWDRSNWFHMSQHERRKVTTPMDPKLAAAILKELYFTHVVDSVALESQFLSGSGLATFALTPGDIYEAWKK
jgi:hypothetical protein